MKKQWLGDVIKVSIRKCIKKHGCSLPLIKEEVGGSSVTARGQIQSKGSGSSHACRLDCRALRMMQDVVDVGNVHVVKKQTQVHGRKNYTEDSLTVGILLLPQGVPKLKAFRSYYRRAF